MAASNSSVGALVNCMLFTLILGSFTAAKVFAESSVKSAIPFEEFSIGLHGPRSRLLEEASGGINVGDRAATAKYQKISKTGKLLGDNATIWSCVYDHSTGLTWEAKTTDRTLHNRDIEFRWGGLNGSHNRPGVYLGRNKRRAELDEIELPKSLMFGDWDYLINASNDEKLCGYDDWRVPDLYESFSLVRCSTQSRDLDLGCSAQPADDLVIGLQFFPNTLAEIYWSSSLTATSGAQNHAWAIHFSNGSDLKQYRGLYKLVRLVRGSKNLDAR